MPMEPPAYRTRCRYSTLSSVSHHPSQEAASSLNTSQEGSMATDAFSEQRMPAQPLTLDPTRTAVIVVDMVNEFFEPGGKMMLAGGTAVYAPVNALLDEAAQAHLPRSHY